MGSIEGDVVGGLSCLPCPYLADPLLGLVCTIRNDKGVPADISQPWRGVAPDTIDAACDTRDARRLKFMIGLQSPEPSRERIVDSPIPACASLPPDSANHPAFARSGPNP